MFKTHQKREKSTHQTAKAGTTRHKHTAASTTQQQSPPPALSLKKAQPHLLTIHTTTTTPTQSPLHTYQTHNVHTTTYRTFATKKTTNNNNTNQTTTNKTTQTTTTPPPKSALAEQLDKLSKQNLTATILNNNTLYKNTTTPTTLATSLLQPPPNKYRLTPPRPKPTANSELTSQFDTTPVRRTPRHAVTHDEIEQMVKKAAEDAAQKRSAKKNPLTDTNQETQEIPAEKLTAAQKRQAAKNAKTNGVRKETDSVFDEEEGGAAAVQPKKRGRKSAAEKDAEMKDDDDNDDDSEEEEDVAPKKPATRGRKAKAAVVNNDDGDETDELEVDEEETAKAKAKAKKTTTSSRISKTDTSFLTSDDGETPILNTLGNPIKRKYTAAEDHKERVFKKQVEIDKKILTSQDTLTMMSWNLAGVRGSIKNGLWDKFDEYPRVPDIVCLQEMKIQTEALEALPEKDFKEKLKKHNYSGIYNLGDKAGYSGVGILYNNTRLKLHAVRNDSGFVYPPPKVLTKKESANGFFKKFVGKKEEKKEKDDDKKDSENDNTIAETTTGTANTQQVIPELNEALVDKIAMKTGDNITQEMRDNVWNCISHEGRIITADFGSFYLITTYVPNSGSELERLSYRAKIYEPVLLEYLLLLQQHKPIIYTGDLNAASDIVDVHQPSSCCKSAGFQAEEVQRINLIATTEKTGLVDSFRKFQGNDVHGYTYWGHRFQGREKDRGWRIDYFMMSQKLYDNDTLLGTMVTDEFKPKSYGGGRISDHAPLWVAFDMTKDVFKDAKL